jgi:hypothetical protein
MIANKKNIFLLLLYFIFYMVLLKSKKRRNTMTYKIIRIYATMGKRPRVMRKGLTLEQAQAHCQDPKTSKAGQWFDGYNRE